MYGQELANSRRMGLDLYFITQDAKKQVDSFVRALSNEHIFLERKFGMEYSMEYVGQKVFDPSSSKELAACQNSRWMFPKEFYGTYKSAEEHTHKRKLPWKKFAVLVLALFAVVGGISLAFHRLSPKKVIAADSSGRPSGQAQSNAGDFWVKDRVFRVAGVPASAPVYDSLQKVKSQPRPEGCAMLVIGASVRCECTGPNHSVLQITVPQCVKLVKGGWFDETQKYTDVKAANISALNGASESEKKESKVE
jgi:zona occludens toxin